MNLTSKLEEDPIYFQIVTNVTVVAVVITGLATYWYFKAQGILVT